MKNQKQGNNIFNEFAHILDKEEAEKQRKAAEKKAKTTRKEQQVIKIKLDYQEGDTTKKIRFKCKLQKEDHPYDGHQEGHQGEKNQNKEIQHIPGLPDHIANLVTGDPETDEQLKKIKEVIKSKTAHTHVESVMDKAENYSPQNHEHVFNEEKDTQKNSQHEQKQKNNVHFQEENPKVVESQIVPVRNTSQNVPREQQDLDKPNLLEILNRQVNKAGTRSDRVKLPPIGQEHSHETGTKRSSSKHREQCRSHNRSKSPKQLHGDIDPQQYLKKGEGHLCYQPPHQDV